MNYYKHIYEWRKSELWFTLLLIFIGALLIKFFKLDEFLVMGIIGASVYKIVRFIAQEQFSWKYIQSLPLHRKEIFKLQLYQAFINYLPLLAFAMIYLDYILYEYFSVKSANWSAYLFGGIILFESVLFIGLTAFRATIEQTRLPYVKKARKNLLLMTLRDSLYWVFALMYGLGILIFGATWLTYQYPELKKVFFTVLSALISGESLAIGVFFILIILYRQIMRRWMNEALSYRKNNWKTVRDIPAMALCVFIFCVLPFSVFETVPAMNRGVALSEAVYKKDFARVSALLSEGANINEKNKSGLSPLMVAAHQGDQEFFEYLESKGASYEGIFLGSDHHHQGMNLFLLAVDGKNPLIVQKLLKKYDANESVEGNSALHIASFNCSPDVMDLLIEHGANIHIPDKNGRTPLHVATMKNCLKGSVALLDAGADPLIKDKDGKIAFDYLKNKKGDLAFYLERKTRLPAGK